MKAHLKEIRMNETYFIALISNLHNRTKFREVTDIEEFYQYKIQQLPFNKNEVLYYRSNTDGNGGELMFTRKVLNSLVTPNPFTNEMKLNEDDLKLLSELNNALPNRTNKYKDKNGNLAYVYILDKSVATFKIYNTSIAVDARKFIRNAVMNHMNEYEFYNLVQKRGLKEIPYANDTTKQAFFSKRYKSSVIEKWCDVTYVDIHKAHASELIKMFSNTGVDGEILDAVEKGNAAKKAGKLELAKYYKDIVNLAVGCFAMKRSGEPYKWLYGVDTKPLFNRIAHNIYLKEMQQLEKMYGENSKLIYAQTDSLMVNHSKYTTDAAAIGEYGVEFQGTVYTYHQKVEGYSGYTVFQYRDKDGKLVTKGNLPDVLKPYIDLEEGIVVYYKLVEIGNTGHYKPANVRLEKVEIHENE